MTKKKKDEILRSIPHIVENIHDKKWRIQNLYKIKNKAGEIIPFKPNIHQEEVFDQLYKHNKSTAIILKARQLGFSTLGIIDIFDDCIWNTNQNCVILAHNKETLEKLFRIVRLAYDTLPEYLKPELDRGKGSRTQLYFPIQNSRISVTLEGRGDTINRLHVSEYAFYDDINKVDITLDSVPKGAKKVIESTPLGINEFHQLWNSNQPINVHKAFFPWFKEPSYSLDTNLTLSDLDEDERKLMERHNLTVNQIEWRRWKIQEKRGSLNFFLENYPEDDKTCFLVSGTCPFDRILISKLIENLPSPIEERGKFGLNGHLRIWERFKDGHNYIIGIDSCEGVGKDFGVISVLDGDSFNQVAELRGHLSPGRLAVQANNLAKLYKNPKTGELPLMVPERNNHGHAVILRLEQNDINYPNMYHSRDGRPGWNTTTATRPLMIDAFIDGVHDKILNINSIETLKECLTFTNNEGKLEAEEGYFDDGIVANSIAFKVALDLKRSGNFEIF